MFFRPVDAWIRAKWYESENSKRALRHSLLIGLFTILLPAALAQRVKPVLVSKLPKILDEASGIAMADSSLLYLINDSGNSNSLFTFHFQKEEFLETAMPAANRDWEDLVLADSVLFIGDFGNNLNNRTDLRIYRFVNRENRWVDDGVIEFAYSGQKEFPPPPEQWNYDCEAVFFHNNSIFLLSKNTGSKRNAITNLYRLPAYAGSYRAELIDSFRLNEPVTAAAYDAGEKKLVLLTYFSLWVFSHSTEPDFLNENVSRYAWKGFTQKEAVCFFNETGVLIADERNFLSGGKPSKLNLNEFSNAEMDLQYNE
jgi:hypothetical protein